MNNTINIEEKMDRIKKCTYPEQYYITKHFKFIYITEKDGRRAINTAIDFLPVNKVQEFIADKIAEDMIEATIRRDNQQTFIAETKKAFEHEQSEWISKRGEDGYIFIGLVPKSKEAKEFFELEYEEWKKENGFGFTIEE